MSIFIDKELEKYYEQSRIVLVDVGASGGIQPHWRKTEKYLQVIGFEPDKREYENLKEKQNSHIRYLNTGLYSEKTTLEYHLTRKQQNSSMFKPHEDFVRQFPQSDRYDVVGTVKIDMDTLDNQFRSNNIIDADFIKVDTEGSELFILQGAKETIKDHVFGIESEIEYVDMHKGQPVFGDVDQFLKNQGFYLFDLQGYYWKRKSGIQYGKGRGQLIFGNAIYLRRLDSFLDVLKQNKDKIQKKAKILKALSICALYGYFDYAYEIFSATKEFFETKEEEKIQLWFNRNQSFSNKIPNFKGRHKVAKLFFKLYELFKPSVGGWGTYDRELGNN